MKKRAVSSFLALMLATASITSPAAAEPLVIVHAIAWTMQGPEPLTDATIVIDKGKIQSVTAGGPVPADARVIDAKSAIVTPGLVNSATQLGLIEVAYSKDTVDASSATDQVGAAFDPSYALNGNSTLVALARADGLTRALAFPDASSVPPFAGQAPLARLRNGVDILDRPRVAEFAIIGGGAWKKVGSRAAQWQLLRAALDDAKAPATQTSILADALREATLDKAALRRVLDGSMPLAIATHRESDIVQAISLATDYRIRVVVVGGGEAWRVADRLAAARIPVVIDPEANMPQTFDQLGNRLDAAAILSKAGVKIAFGIVGGGISQSYNAGLELRRSAGLAVANGLPYVDALRAITVNPAAIWDDGARFGTLAPATEADLVIWDGDPLEPSTLATTVIIEGQPVSTDTRQKELQRRYYPQAAD